MNFFYNQSIFFKTKYTRLICNNAADFIFFLLKYNIDTCIYVYKIHNMNYRKTNIFAFLICCLFIFSSCREIITPVDNQEETASILNNPFESATPNSYSFEISARNNSSNYANAIPVLQSLNLSLALSNYNSGTVHIKLINRERIIVYNRIFDFAFASSTVNLDGLAPSQVNVKFNNFSGDFSLNINGNP